MGEMVETLDNLHRVMRLWRRAARLSQEQWGALVGVTKKTVSEWERTPGVSMRVEHIMRFMQAVQVDSLREFLAGPPLERLP